MKFFIKSNINWNTKETTSKNKYSTKKAKKIYKSIVYKSIVNLYKKKKKLLIFKKNQLKKKILYYNFLLNTINPKIANIKRYTGRPVDFILANALFELSFELSFESS